MLPQGRNFAASSSAGGVGNDAGKEGPRFVAEPRCIPEGLPIRRREKFAENKFRHGTVKG